jgi:SAM-dependent methyltransferase
VRANVLEGLPFPSGQFCYTHQGLLVAAIPARAWPTVVQELVHVTRPGGWIELLELSDLIQPAGRRTGHPAPAGLVHQHQPAVRL